MQPHIRNPVCIIWEVRRNDLCEFSTPAKQIMLFTVLNGRIGKYL